MKRLLIALMMLPALSQAECLMHTNIKINLMKLTSPPVDFQKIVVPDPKGFHCTARYRVNISGNWKDAEGQGTAKDKATACTTAMNVANGVILDETPKTVSSTMQMVCSDFKDIHVHPVRIGDTIHESEVDIHSVPAERPYFYYKRTLCRMFVERTTEGQDLWLYQGIICQISPTSGSLWRVIDKY
jgi:hypothetical protein